MTHFTSRHLACLLVLLAAGCAVRPVAPPEKVEAPVEAQQRRAKAPRPAYNLAGYPPAVRDGYIDGCESAKRSRLARKDPKRMAEEPQYAMGWNDGWSM